jgi:glycosyltransferase involved in cell wall biosynthesis
MNELVSVYMPTRNRLKLLQRAITSVLGQSYPHFELVVVNDGSTDATCIYLDQLQIADARVKPIHNESSVGAPRSRNMAIQTASGEFVTGLDDDDYFHRDRLQALIDHWHALEQLQQHFSSIFTQDVVIKGEKNTLSAKPRSVNADDLFFHNAIGNQIFTRRGHFIDAGLFDEAMPAWQDLDAFIRVLRKFGPAKLLDRGSSGWRPLYAKEWAMSAEMSAKRFRIAFSFAGEKRNFVAQVAALLARRFTEAGILYDKFHEAEFARRNLGIYLPDLYHDHAELVVVVVCLDYDVKQWTGLEWVAIHDLLIKAQG